MKKNPSYYTDGKKKTLQSNCVGCKICSLQAGASQAKHEYSPASGLHVFG